MAAALENALTEEASPSSDRQLWQPPPHQTFYADDPGFDPELMVSYVTFTTQSVFTHFHNLNKTFDHAQKNMMVRPGGM